MPDGIPDNTPDSNCGALKSLPCFGAQYVFGAGKGRLRAGNSLCAGSKIFTPSFSSRYLQGGYE